MKKIYFLLFLLCGAAQAQIVNIPDPGFKFAILNAPGIDANNDSELQLSEAQAQTSLSIGAFGVSSLEGLEAFTNLTSLELFLISLPSPSVLDLTAMTNLETLHLPGCVFDIVNVSGLSHLKHVNLSNCQVSSIDLSASATTLEYLNASFTRLNNMTYSGFTNLNYLDTSWVSGQSQANITVSGLPNLKFLDCSHIIGNITVSNLPSLETLRITDNYLNAFDPSIFPTLKHLECFHNFLTSLNVASLTNLEHLNCGENMISSIDISPLVNLTYLDIGGNPLGALDVSPFVQLETLRCYRNNLPTLDVSMLSNLKELNCADNQLTSLGINNLTTLETVNCSNNQLGSIDISNLSLLKTLSVGQNPLGQIDISNAPLLEHLVCNDNLLTALDVTTAPMLKSLNCSSNQITVIDLSNNTHLNIANCSNNLFSTLDFSHYVNDSSDVFDNTDYRFSGNPLLTFVNLKNGITQNFSVDFNSLNCPNLVYICADEANIWYLQSALQIGGATNVQLNSYCSFTPGGAYNTISGTVTIDVNNNGCGAGDPTFPNFKIDINDGTNTGTAFTLPNGNYSFFTQSGNFTVTPVMENSYFTLTPASANLTFNALDGSTQVQNFCITPNGIHNDLEVSIIPTDAARPGFDASYVIIYRNKGNQTLSGAVNLAFDDNILDFVTASPATTATAANFLTWDFTALEPFQTRAISLTMNVNSPLETPAVNIDDHLFYTASITANNDETPDDNQMTLDQIVVGSFDPNDKTCAEGSVIRPEMVGDYLHYVIRFQNSGTFYAENVVVTDIIDTNKFDLASLQLTASSHPHTTRITGNKVEFIFEGINLPAEQDDEPGSHGFVAFKIKTKPMLVLNDVVENTADIFFDFNAPITTNTTSTTVSNLGIGDVADIRVSMTPNPVTDMLYISAQDDMQSVQVFDLQGRLLQTRLENDTQAAVDFSDKTTGVYFVKVTTGKGTKTEKIVKE